MKRRARATRGASEGAWGAESLRVGLARYAPERQRVVTGRGAERCSGGHKDGEGLP